MCPRGYTAEQQTEVYFAGRPHGQSLAGNRTESPQGRILQNACRTMQFVLRQEFAGFLHLTFVVAKGVLQFCENVADVLGDFVEFCEIESFARRI